MQYNEGAATVYSTLNETVNIECNLIQYDA